MQTREGISAYLADLLVRCAKLRKYLIRDVLWRQLRNDMLESSLSQRGQVEFLGRTKRQSTHTVDNDDWILTSARRKIALALQGLGAFPGHSSLPALSVIHVSIHSVLPKPPRSGPDAVRLRLTGPEAVPRLRWSSDSRSTAMKLEARGAKTISLE